ncbi:MAG: beta-N-acetylhexosaminidase [Deltaproteobacteria bacterium]|nr:beta-N-acetylhexosaminidase [Deltaproteobacteria bacterium]
MTTTLEPTELDHKIGQVFMLGIPEPYLDEQTEGLIRDYHVGGIILFSRNIQGPIQVAELCGDIQKAAHRYHAPPLFLAVDQEGGRVSRLKEPFTLFPGNMAIGHDPDPVEKARVFGEITAREMRLVGLNMDLAPVVDVGRGEVERHLEGRTFGEDPEMVARLGGMVVKTLQQNGVMAVAKHFPGLGKANLDPHMKLPHIGLDAEELERADLIPFMEAIKTGVSGIMTSHAVYPHLDPHWPATLSCGILTGLLRDRLGFQGLIITDDLEMGAIARQWSVAEGAAQAFQAGADLLLICREQSHFLTSMALIREKISRNEILMDRLQQANKRIMDAKSRFLKESQPVKLAEVDRYFKGRA